MTIGVNEPTLESIEDYNGNESIEKKRTIWIVIISGLLIGTIYTYLQVNSKVDDQISNTQDMIKVFK